MILERLKSRNQPMFVALSPFSERLNMSKLNFIVNVFLFFVAPSSEEVSYTTLGSHNDGK